MTRTTVYSWRLAPNLKLALEEVARHNQESVAEVLDRIVRESFSGSTSGDEEEEQRCLHSAAARYFGAIDGGDPDRAERARETLRERLAPTPLY